MNKRLSFSLAALIVVFSIALSACGPAATPTEAPTAVPPTAVPPTSVPPTVAPTAAPTTAPAKPTPIPPVCNALPNAMSPKAGSLGASDNPIVIVFVPSVDVSKITTGGQAMADCLGKMTGLTFKILVGTSENAAIEAMGGGKAQIGFLNTFSVLLAHEKYNVDVELVAQRKYGYQNPVGTYHTFDFDPDKDLVGQLEPFYKPEFFTRADTGIKTLADIKGHSFCFTSAGSTSGGVIPRAMFQGMGINPDTDMKSTFAGGHPQSATAVYQGTCDAGVAFMDILTDPPTNLVGKFPDLLQKVQVFAVGPRIPNDGVQFVQNFDPNMKALFLDAVTAMEADPGGNAVVYSIYAYNGFEKAGYDKYYAPFEDLLKKAGVDVSKLVKQ